jgi:type I restriction enzyme, S subunit
MVNYNIIQKSELVSTRLDPEFYQKELTMLDYAIEQIGSVSFNELIHELTDYTANGSFANLKLNVKVTDQVSYAKWIRIQNLDANDFERNIRYVGVKGYEFLKKSKLFGDELLISKTGEYLGKAYLFMPDSRDERFTLADNIFLIRLKNSLLNGFILSFINSKPGRKLLLRWSQGTGQPTIIKNSLRSIKIPTPNSNTIQKFNDLIQQYYNNISKSKFLYAQAFKLLEKGLGLNDFSKTRRVTTSISLSEISKTHRFDAQCFKPELIQYENWIERNCNFEKLGSLLFTTVKGQQKTVLDNGFLPYVSIKDIKNLEVIPAGYCKTFPLPAEKFDLLLAITGATIGKIGMVYRSEQMAFSGDLLNLKVNTSKISPFYLSLVLKSPIGQTQFNRWITGSTNGHLSPFDVRKIAVPRLSPEAENKIAEWIEESIKLLIESERLLDYAKFGIEKLIEHGNLDV